jgi:hypothetical protein
VAKTIQKKVSDFPIDSSVQGFEMLKATKILAGLYPQGWYHLGQYNRYKPNIKTNGNCIEP